jgi:hypothetical protein
LYRALLGDAKAKLGVSFIYDQPTGSIRDDADKPVPKFEWQRKYNAPREEYARNNEAGWQALVQDKPFGIDVSACPQTTRLTRTAGSPCVLSQVSRVWTHGARQSMSTLQQNHRWTR